jgi:hypothetical protein
VNKINPISFNKSRKILGAGLSKKAVLSSTLLAILSFVYVFAAGSSLKITIYILLNRVTYINTFDYYIVGQYPDKLIVNFLTLVWLFLSIRAKVIRFIASGVYGILLSVAILANVQVLLDMMSLASVPAVVILLVYDKKNYAFIRDKIKKPLYDISLGLTANYIAIIGIVMGVASLVVSVIDILFSISIPIRYNYAYVIFLFFSSASPPLLLLLIFCFPVKLLFKELLGQILKLNKRLFSAPLNFQEKLTTKKLAGRSRLIYLLIFILLSIGIALIPHLPTINRDNQNVGADSPGYVNWLNTLSQSKNLQVFLQEAFIEIQGGDRPLTLLFLFILNEITNADPLYVVEYVPVLLGPSLVIVIYFFTRELTSNEIASLLAAFLTAMASFHVLIGIYAGFYANWFALIFGYSSFIFLLKFLMNSRIRNLYAFAALIIILLFSHVYTWTIFAMVMSIFLGVMLVFNYHSRRAAALLLLVILSSVIVDISKTSITGSSGGLEKDIQITKARVGMDQLASRWANLLDTTQHYLGSIYSNFIILILALYWLWRSDLKAPSNMLIAIFLSVGILPLFVGDWVVQSRVLYNIPFQIPAAIGLAYLKNRAHGTVYMLPICIWLIAISVRTVSNLYHIEPQ